METTHTAPAMAPASSKAATRTTLVVAGIKAEVGLFTTEAKPSALADFDRAGPHGGKLVMETKAVEVKEDELSAGDEAVRMDPLAEDPGPIDEAPIEEPPAPKAVTEGEYRNVLVEEGTGEEVAPEQVRRGVRLDDGRFIDLTEQIDAIQERTKLDRMEVVSFFDIGQIQRERISGSYYIAAADKTAPHTLRALYEGMRKRRRAAIVKLTKRSRQSLGVIVASSKRKSLILHELIWQEDFRAAPEKALAIQQAIVSEREVAATCKLIDAMADTREALDELRDDAIALREELRARAEAGEMDVRVVEPVAVEAAEDDLEAALEASLAAISAA